MSGIKRAQSRIYTLHLLHFHRMRSNKDMDNLDIFTILLHSLNFQVSVLALSLILLSVAMSVVLFLRNNKCPPGPSPISLLRHTLLSSVDKPWIYFKRLGMKYGSDNSFSSLIVSNLNNLSGSVVNVSFAGEEVLVLNTAEDAEELVSNLNPVVFKSSMTIFKLTRRSQNYSSRKPIIFSGKYKSNNKRIILLPYGVELRKQRTAYHNMLQSNLKSALLS